MKYLNCTECGFHEIILSSEEEWSYEDDIKVICRITRNEIAPACKIYNIKEKCKIPDWCPFK